MPSLVVTGSSSSNTQDQGVTYYANLIGQKQGAKYKAGYLAFVAAHPGNYTPYQLAIAYEATLIAQGLGTAIAKVGTFVGSGVPNAAATAAEKVAGGVSSACLISLPKVGPVSLGGCIFTKTEARALIGGVILTGAVVIGITAGVLLVSYGLTGTKAGQAAVKSATTIGTAYAKIPGLGSAGRKIANANR